MVQFHSENSNHPMKTAQTSPLPEETPWARRDRAFRTVIKVPKEALLKEEPKVKRQSQKERNKKDS
jgi:hypothetical protein